MGRRATSSHPGVEVRSGALRIYFRWQGQLVRENLKLKPTAPNLRYAARLRSDIVHRIEAGIFRYQDYFPDSPRADKINAPTFTELAARWLNTNNQLAPSTLNGYQKTIRRVFMPRFESRAIDTIAYSELAETVAAYPWKSNKTRNNALTPIRGIFELARMDGVIEDNPADRLKSAKVQKPAPDPLTLDEVNTLLDWMGQHQGPQVRSYFEFAIFTGLRTSELIALRWEDIDFPMKLCRVQRAKVLGETKGTKTHTIRDVELNSRALDALTQQKRQSYLSYQEVFLHPHTRAAYNDDKAPRLFWCAALKSLGMRQRSAYQTRHTFATLNLMASANPMWVARQMGHTTMKMLLERYSRWIDFADKGSERDKLEVFLQGLGFGSQTGNQIQK